MDAEKKGGKTDVGEIDLRRLDQPFLNVLEKRRQFERYIGRL